MDKWDVICDDARNPDFEGFEEFLEFGKSYKLTIEEIEPTIEPIKEFYVEKRASFDEVIEKFKNKELNVKDWNFASSKNSKYGVDRGHGNYCAYIMGCGAEDCLANKHGFNSREEIVELFKELGVTHVLYI